jgi:hypothetical protein
MGNAVELAALCIQLHWKSSTFRRRQWASSCHRVQQQKELLRQLTRRTDGNIGTTMDALPLWRGLCYTVAASRPRRESPEASRSNDPKPFATLAQHPCSTLYLRDNHLTVRSLHQLVIDHFCIGQARDPNGTRNLKPPETAVTEAVPKQVESQSPNRIGVNGFLVNTALFPQYLAQCTALWKDDDAPSLLEGQGSDPDEVRRWEMAELSWRLDWLQRIIVGIFPLSLIKRDPIADTQGERSPDRTTDSDASIEGEFYFLRVRLDAIEVEPTAPSPSFPYRRTPPVARIVGADRMDLLLTAVGRTGLVPNTALLLQLIERSLRSHSSEEIADTPANKESMGAPNHPSSPSKVDSSATSAIVDRPITEATLALVYSKAKTSWATIPWLAAECIEQLDWLLRNNDFFSSPSSPGEAPSANISKPSTIKQHFAFWVWLLYVLKSDTSRAFNLFQAFLDELGSWLLCPTTHSRVASGGNDVKGRMLDWILNDLPLALQENALARLPYLFRRSSAADDSNSSFCARCFVFPGGMPAAIAAYLAAAEALTKELRVAHSPSEYPVIPPAMLQLLRLTPISDYKEFHETMPAVYFQESQPQSPVVPQPLSRIAFATLNSSLPSPEALDEKSKIASRVRQWILRDSEQKSNTASTLPYVLIVDPTIELHLMDLWSTVLDPLMDLIGSGELLILLAKSMQKYSTAGVGRTMLGVTTVLTFRDPSGLSTPASDSARRLASSTQDILSQQESSFSLRQCQCVDLMFLWCFQRLLPFAEFRIVHRASRNADFVRRVILPLGKRLLDQLTAAMEVNSARSESQAPTATPERYDGCPFYLIARDFRIDVSMAEEGGSTKANLEAVSGKGKGLNKKRIEVWNAPKVMSKLLDIEERDSFGGLATSWLPMTQYCRFSIGVESRSELVRLFTGLGFLVALADLQTSFHARRENARPNLPSVEVSKATPPMLSLTQIKELLQKVVDSNFNFLFTSSGPELNNQRILLPQVVSSLDQFSRNLATVLAEAKSTMHF